MSTGLLLSCIAMMVTMMHLSCMASQPTETRLFLERIKHLKLAMRNLEMAEKSYTKHIFNLTGSLELLEGVVLFEGNTTSKKIQTSACVIIDCLNHTLPEIVRDFTPSAQLGARRRDRHGIIGNVTTFLHQLKRILTCGQTQAQCVNTTGLQDYEVKQTGLRILNTTTRWMESLM